MEDRVTETKELLHPDQWTHCLGTINPANVASYISGMVEFLVNSCWFKALPFLRKRTDQWPVNKLELYPPNELIYRSLRWIQTLRKETWVVRFLDWPRWLEGNNNLKVVYVEKRMKLDDLERAKRRVIAGKHFSCAVLCETRKKKSDRRTLGSNFCLHESLTYLVS